MSHQQLFMSFRQGEVSPFAFDTLVSVLERHRCTVSSRDNDGHTVSFPMDGKDFRIGDYGSIAIDDDAAVEFGVERPRYQPEFYALALDLITKLDLCMVISSGDEVFVSRKDLVAELPEPLADVASVVDGVEGFSSS